MSGGDPTVVTSFANAADDVWKTLDRDPAGWQRPTQCANCEVPPRVALAYRGHYHRHILTRHVSSCATGVAPGSKLVCSDFLNNVDTHWRQLVGPLEAAGAAVKTYFHTYRSGDDKSSQQRDDRLVDLLRPARYDFASYSTGARIRDDDDDEDEDEAEDTFMRDGEDGESSLIVDSFIKVLEMVLQDEESIDAVILARFDVRYRDPITALNVRWNVTNAAHREGPDSWAREKRLSDLFFVLPIEHVKTFIKALKISAHFPHNHKATGAGHWIYMPFVENMGGDPSVLNIIDSFFSPSTFTPCQSPTFLGISRTCGVGFQ
jgi:hypothetical protein